MKRVIQQLVGSIAGVLALVTQIGWAVPIQFSIDTSSLSGTSAQLAFDFIDGGPPPNTASVSGFATDGTLGAVSTVGGVVGTLPNTVTLTDSAFFNEYLQALILGS